MRIQFTESTCTGNKFGKHCISFEELRGQRYMFCNFYGNDGKALSCACSAGFEGTNCQKGAYFPRFWRISCFTC